MKRAVYILVIFTIFGITHAQDGSANLFNRSSGHNFQYFIIPEKANPPADRRKHEELVENYFRIDGNETSLWNGKHWLPERFPLKVYIERGKPPLFNKVYIEYINYAMNIWKEADPRIDFVNVLSKSNADIIITFKNNLRDKYKQDYLGLTDYKINDSRIIDKAYVEIGMLKFEDELLTQGEIKRTIIHELGHALGLGHSDNQSDLMFPYIDPVSDAEMDYRELSASDQLAVRSVISLGYLLPVILN